MEKRNKILKLLGFNTDAKLLIIHADDAGLSHAQNAATIEALKYGIVNSYSMMVPCPWFFEMANFALENEEYDYGIHLTITCEWENYRFGPVLSSEIVPSLVDKNGFFLPKREMVKIQAKTQDIRAEFCAQIEKALDMGLTPSHLDSHMYSVGSSPEIFSIYKEVGRAFELPVLINQSLMNMVGLDVKKNLSVQDFHIDNVFYGDYDIYLDGSLKDYYNSVLTNLENGLNMILIHPAYNNQEMQAITINHPNFGADWRQIDFDFFTSEECKELIVEHDIKLVTWRDIQNVL